MRLTIIEVVKTQSDYAGQPANLSFSQTFR